MRIEIRTKDHYKTTDWSGGKTTELYIGPEGADYGTREFEVRISSATVELEKSVFTKLNGFRRELMILRGEMKLVHQGRRTRQMVPYDVDSFMGSWDTESYGMVRDFNLMALEEMETSLVYQCVAAGESYFVMGIDNPDGRQQMLAIYVIEGEGSLEKQTMKANELCVIHDYKEETLQLDNSGTTPLKLAICSVLK